MNEADDAIGLLGGDLSDRKKAAMWSIRDFEKKNNASPEASK